MRSATTTSASSLANGPTTLQWHSASPTRSSSAAASMPWTSGSDFSIGGTSATTALSPTTAIGDVTHGVDLWAWVETSAIRSGSSASRSASSRKQATASRVATAASCDSPRARSSSVANPTRRWPCRSAKAGRRTVETKRRSVAAYWPTFSLESFAGRLRTASMPPRTSTVDANHPRRPLLWVTRRRAPTLTSVRDALAPLPARAGAREPPPRRRPKLQHRVPSAPARRRHHRETRASAVRLPGRPRAGVAAPLVLAVGHGAMPRRLRR
mmetsp:Transcript_74964/g.208421  ORF Transcript_74964/g.208421 Transcript_74964/m.208421 type:complete len:269 (+) Transcript_74964:358-1164(+)